MSGPVANRPRQVEDIRAARSGICRVCAVVIALASIVALSWALASRSHAARRGIRVIDLFAEFDRAEKRAGRPVAEAFARKDVSIEGDARRAILAHPPSRLIFPLTVPARASLRTDLALEPSAWDLSRDGVMFRIGISDDRHYEALYARHLHPGARREDRSWIPVELDLSSFGGLRFSLFFQPGWRTWRLVFSTDPGPPGSADVEHDWAVWGNPRIEAAR